MIEERTTKPKLLRRPLAWTLRKLRLRWFDFMDWLGFHRISRLDFRNMMGGDFAHVIDVGVADGSPDLYARFPNAVLDLFEPKPEYQRHIELTIVKQRSARLHKMGLGSTDGTSDLFLKGRTGSSFVIDRGRGSVSVPVRRLDTVLTVDMIRRPCLLKIDTEGYELEVLRGAEGLMQVIDCVVAEVSFYIPTCPPHALVMHLDALGFEFTEVLDFSCGGGRMWSADFVFRRRETGIKTLDVPATDTRTNLGKSNAVDPVCSATT